MAAPAAPKWDVPDKWKNLHEDQLAEAAPFDATEQKTLALLKQEFTPQVIEALPPAMVTRFIRGYAKEAEPEKETVNKLRECLKWRSENKVEEIAHMELPNEALFRKMWPSGFHGRCKQGRPIYVDRVGQIDPHLLNKTFDMAALLKFHIKQMERLNAVKEEVSQFENRLVYKHIAIIDMNGFGMAHMGSDFTTPMKSFLNIDQYFYPESLYKLIVCNAPWAFKLLWKMASPWLHPLTKARIKVGSHHLKELIDDDQIPVLLGGKCKCPAGKCLEVPFEDGRAQHSNRGFGAAPAANGTAAKPAAAAAAPAAAPAAAGAGASADVPVPGHLKVAQSEIDAASLSDSVDKLDVAADAPKSS